MSYLSVNMKQMHKFQVYDDSVIAFDQIVRAKGKFLTDRPDIYTRWLNEFGIFYTLTTEDHAHDGRTLSGN